MGPPQGSPPACGEPSSKRKHTATDSETDPPAAKRSRTSFPKAFHGGAALALEHLLLDDPSHPLYERNAAQVINAALDGPEPFSPLTTPLVELLRHDRLHVPHITAAKSKAINEALARSYAKKVLRQLGQQMTRAFDVQNRPGKLTITENADGFKVELNITPVLAVDEDDDDDDGVNDETGNVHDGRGNEAEARESTHGSYDGGAATDSPEGERGLNGGSAREQQNAETTISEQRTSAQSSEHRSSEQWSSEHRTAAQPKFRQPSFGQPVLTRSILQRPTLGQATFGQSTVEQRNFLQVTSEQAVFGRGTFCQPTLVEPTLREQSQSLGQQSLGQQTSGPQTSGQQSSAQQDRYFGMPEGLNHKQRSSWKWRAKQREKRSARRNAS